MARPIEWPCLFLFHSATLLTRAEDCGVIFLHKVAVVYDDAFLTRYDTVDCESPDRISSVLSHLEDIADFVRPAPCSEADLLLCHSRALVDSVREDGTLFEVAALAAGGAIRAAETCREGPCFALVRPPGHHAGGNFNGGFCFFNNIVVAVKKMLVTGAIRSALIVDIDLHYGNGTAHIFKDDRRVTFRNISAPTRPGFFEVLEHAVADGGKYDMVGCSAGFDTSIGDWGNLLLTEDFGKIGAALASSNPCFFSVLEGGYYIEDLGKNVRAYLEGIGSACS